MLPGVVARSAASSSLEHSCGVRGETQTRAGNVVGRKRRGKNDIIEDLEHVRIIARRISTGHLRTWLLGDLDTGLETKRYPQVMV